MRKKYTRVIRICEWCQAEFLGTNRAKYCCPTHNALASKDRTDKESIWDEIKSLREKELKVIDPTILNNKTGKLKSDADCLPIEMAQTYETKIAELKKQSNEYFYSVKAAGSILQNSKPFLSDYYEGVKLTPENREVLKQILKRLDSLP